MQTYPMNHWAVYNGKAVEMDTTPPKQQFKRACQRIIDNNHDGHVITPKGEVYVVARSCRMAKPVRDPAEAERVINGWYGITDYPYTLANDPTPHRPARFENGDKRQRVCVEGMDLLPGQMDLF
jgi:hypothetical protein